MMMMTSDETPEPYPGSEEELEPTLTAHFDKNMTKPKINNVFKMAEKKYKLYQNKKTDFSNLIDFETVIPDQAVKLDLIHPVTKQPLNAYMFTDPEGLIVIKNYFSLKEQIRMAYQALNKYIYEPYRTNLYIYEDSTPYPQDYILDLAKNPIEQDLNQTTESNVAN
jgi:hypothetical protein